jgi:undecaprenyl-diphosphatase
MQCNGIDAKALNMDKWLLMLVNQGWANGWIDPWMVGLSTVGLAYCGWLTLAAWRQAGHDPAARRLAWALGLAQATAVIGTLIFYGLAARARPDGVRLILAAPPLPSYFSGHTAVAVATGTVWALAYGRTRRTVALLLLVVGIGYSRIYLGHHYPSDVVGGALWGAGMGAAGFGVAYRAGTWAGLAGWLIWPQVALSAVVTQMAYLDILPMGLLAWPYADKVLHLLLIGALAFWLNLWRDGATVRMGPWPIPLAVLLPFGIAFGEEIMQSFSPVRTFDLLDLGADLVGLWLFYWISERLRKRLALKPMGLPPA